MIDQLPKVVPILRALEEVAGQQGHRAIVGQQHDHVLLLAPGEDFFPGLGWVWVP